MNPTPEQCIDLLTKATAPVQTDRQGHANIQLALKVLSDLIESTKPKEKEKSK
jgi:hypothetical protein